MALGNQWYCTLPQLAYTSTSTYHIEFMIVTFVQQVYMNQKADKKNNQGNDLRLTQSFIRQIMMDFIHHWIGFFDIVPTSVNSLTLIDDELSINQVTLSSFLSGENHLLSHDLGWESCQLFKSRQMCGTQELVHRHVSHRHIHIFLYTVFRYIHIVVLDVCGFQIITYVLSVKCPYIMFQCFFSKVTLHQMISKRDRDIMSKYLKAHGEV